MADSVRIDFIGDDKQLERTVLKWNEDLRKFEEHIERITFDPITQDIDKFASEFDLAIDSVIDDLDDMNREFEETARKIRMLQNVATGFFIGAEAFLFNKFLQTSEAFDELQGAFDRLTTALARQFEVLNPIFQLAADGINNLMDAIERSQTEEDGWLRWIGEAVSGADLANAIEAQRGAMIDAEREALLGSSGRQTQQGEVRAGWIITDMLDSLESAGNSINEFGESMREATEENMSFSSILGNLVNFAEADFGRLSGFDTAGAATGAVGGLLRGGADLFGLAQGGLARGRLAANRMSMLASAAILPEDQGFQASIEGAAGMQRRIQQSAASVENLRTNEAIKENTQKTVEILEKTEEATANLAEDIGKVIANNPVLGLLAP